MEQMMRVVSNNAALRQRDQVHQSGLDEVRLVEDRLDEVIATIRAAADPPAAKAALMERFGLSALQSQAILDMRLQRLTALERDKIAEELDGIAVEIKGFLGPSTVSACHAALGQYLHYRMVLDKEDPERILYLAVPIDTYDTFFGLVFTQTSVQRHGVHLIVYDPETEALLQWIRQRVTGS
jgi:hypothetical protein